MEDYRKVIIQLNKDYNIEEIYNQVEAGIYALERLLVFSKLVPSFDVVKDIEDAYGEDIRIEKDFIKFGLNFVETFEAKSRKADVMTDSPQLSQLDCLTTKHVEQIEVVKEETAVIDVKPEPSKVYFNLEAKSSKKEEVGNDDSTPVHDEGVASVQVEIRRKKKKRRSKEKRQERLHKFHQKLVKTRGLPPIRFMEHRETGLDDVKKNLDGEFDQVHEQYRGDTDHRVPVPAPAVAEPNQSRVGVKSSQEQISSLYSSPPATGLVWGAGTPGSEARPCSGWSGSGIGWGCWNTQQSPYGLCQGYSSGLTNYSTLSPCAQSCVGLRGPCQPRSIIPGHTGTMCPGTP